MRFTVLLDDGNEKLQASINPARIDGARPWRTGEGTYHGTLLEIGPDEVHVEEPWEQVLQDLEDAWEDEGMVKTNRMWEPLTPFMQLLPLILPFILSTVQEFARERGFPVPGGFGIPRPPMPDGPGPIPMPSSVCEDPPAPETSNPPRDVLEGEVATVTCRNCGGVFAPAHLCPGCGAVLVGKG